MSTSILPNRIFGELFFEILDISIRVSSARGVWEPTWTRRITLGWFDEAFNKEAKSEYLKI